MEVAGEGVGFAGVDAAFGEGQVDEMEVVLNGGAVFGIDERDGRELSGVDGEYGPAAEDMDFGVAVAEESTADGLGTDRSDC